MRKKEQIDHKRIAELEEEIDRLWAEDDPEFATKTIRRINELQIKIEQLKKPVQYQSESIKTKILKTLKY